MVHQIVWREWRHRQLVWLAAMILLAALGGLFAREHAAQQAYLLAYEQRISKGITSDKKLGGPTIYGDRLQYERAQLHAGPTAYAKAYLASLDVYLHSAENGNGVGNIFGSLAVGGDPASMPSFSSTEITNTYDELTRVVKGGMVPFYPTRQLLDELTPERYGHDPDTYSQNVATTGARFYTNGWYFIGHALRNNWLLPFILIVILFCSTAFAGELNRAHPHLQMLTINGVSPVRLWLGRLAAGVLTTAATIVLPVSLFLAGSLLVSPAGSLQYPILRWHIDGSETFMTLAAFLGRGAVLLLLVIILGFAVTMFWSVLTRNALIAAVLTALTAGLGVFIQRISWLPFPYLNVGAVSNGFAFYQMGSGSFTQAVIVLILWSAVLLVGTLTLLHRNRRYAYDFRN